MERHADRVRSAFADVHHQPLAGEACVGRDRRADDAAFERLAAQGGQAGEEIGGRRGARRGATGGGEERESDQRFYERRLSSARFSARMRRVRTAALAAEKISATCHRPNTKGSTPISAITTQ